MLSKIKENWETIAIVLMVCGVFLWGKSCGSKTIEPQEPKVTTITKYRDTIFPPDTVINLPTKLVPYPVYVKDTTGLKPQPVDSLELHRFFVYNDNIEDSNVKIYSKIVTQGKTLNSFKPSYKLKVPLIIKDSTVVKQDSLVYRPYKYEIHAGGIVGFKTLAPIVEMSINKATYGAGYDILNKSIIFTVKYRLFGWTPKERKKHVKS